MVLKLTEQNNKTIFTQKIIQTIIDDMQKSKKTAAALKCADNKNLQYKCQEYFVRKKFFSLFQANLSLIYYTIVASLSKSKVEQDGTLKFGEALAKCAFNIDKINKLLSCNSVKELCGNLKSILSIINSKKINLQFSSLLLDCCLFNTTKRRLEVKTRWLQQYIHHNH